MDDLLRALPNLIRAAGEADEVAEAAALVVWRHVAGEALRGCAVPFRLYRKTLVVAVPDTTWQKQLEAISGQLLFRLNSVLGQAMVTFIEFRVDRATVQAERARMPSFAAVNETGEESALDSAAPLQEAAAAIHDETLRRRFLIAAGSYMNAQGGRKQ
ncbi:MAG: DUF721 domain-containing protein [Pyrinomonadaceae bacterium]